MRLTHSDFADRSPSWSPDGQHLVFSTTRYGNEELALIDARVGDAAEVTRLTWDLILDEDFRSRPQSLLSWAGDGVIADFDDPLLVELLADGHIPVVGVGGSYQRDSDYPPGIPYVATDNRRLVELAYRHLIDMGPQRFALYSMPPAPTNRWAQEREARFRRIALSYVQYNFPVYRL